MKRLFLCIFVALHIPTAVNATVFEFGSDGSVTTYIASDYLAESRRQKKKPQVSKYMTSWQPKGNFNRYIKAASIQYDIDPRIIHAVIETESRYKTDALSPKGARGLMQLMPSTAAQYGDVDLFDPEQNIDVGTRHLKYLLKKYDDDLPIAFAAYNAGEGAVTKYGGIPPYPETVDYVRKITLLLGIEP
jgi:soluble lytic murein transglycosylase-like protein